MNEHSGAHPIAHAIKSLFGSHKSRNITLITRKNDYYQNHYFSNNLSDGIDMVAAVELTSKIATAKLLMKAGLSSYMGRKIIFYQFLPPLCAYACFVFPLSPVLIYKNFWRRGMWSSIEDYCKTLRG